MDERGFVPVDKQMRTNVMHIFAIGDVVGQPMLAWQGGARGQGGGGGRGRQEPRLRRPRHPLGRLHRPGGRLVGMTENEAKAKGIKYGKGVFPGPPRAARSASGGTTA